VFCRFRLSEKDTIFNKAISESTEGHPDELSPGRGAAGTFRSVHERLIRARVAIESSARSASFTDLESGNARLNSGSRSTTLVPARYRSTYLPRTPPEKSYSGLISTATRLERGFFLVFPAFMPCRGASTDQSRPLSSHSMNYYQEPPLAGHPDGYKALLYGAVIRVWDRNRERVAKHGACLRKCNPMFTTVGQVFCRVPFKWQPMHSL
jgi:hypothetical protein